jgi:hypothetical protein
MLVPQLTTELNRFLDEKHFYGRDIIADTLAGLLGVEALPLLIAASVRDLGDDQDTLNATINDAMWSDKARDRTILHDLGADGSPEVRQRAAGGARPPRRGLIPAAPVIAVQRRGGFGGGGAGPVRGESRRRSWRRRVRRSNGCGPRSPSRPCSCAFRGKVALGPTAGLVSP